VTASHRHRLTVCWIFSAVSLYRAAKSADHASFSMSNCLLERFNSVAVVGRWSGLNGGTGWVWATHDEHPSRRWDAQKHNDIQLEARVSVGCSDNSSSNSRSGMAAVLTSGCSTRRICHTQGSALGCVACRNTRVPETKRTTHRGRASRLTVVFLVVSLPLCPCGRIRTRGKVTFKRTLTRQPLQSCVSRVQADLLQKVVPMIITSQDAVQ
jgi:hypothetical protein